MCYPLVSRKVVMKINFDKHDGSCKDNVWTFYLSVKAKKGTPLAQENANTEYKVEVIFDDVEKTKVKHMWLVDKNKLGY